MTRNYVSNPELLEDQRQVAAIREAKYKANLERYYNQRVKSQQFKPGEYVFRSNAASRAGPQLGRPIPD
jgi:hypothetical protein